MKEAFGRLRMENVRKECNTVSGGVGVGGQCVTGEKGRENTNLDAKYKLGLDLILPKVTRKNLTPGTCNIGSP